jgi:hypothetical protein
MTTPGSATGVGQSNLLNQFLRSNISTSSLPNQPLSPSISTCNLPRRVWHTRNPFNGSQYLPRLLGMPQGLSFKSRQDLKPGGLQRFRVPQ